MRKKESKKHEDRERKRDVAISKWLRVATSLNLTMHGDENKRSVSINFTLCSSTNSIIHIFHLKINHSEPNIHPNLNIRKSQNVTFVLAFFS